MIFNAKFANSAKLPISARLAKSTKLVVAVAGVLGCGIAAYAAAPADTIAARQANFKQMGKGMKAISEQLKAPAPAGDAIKAGAAAIDQAAGKVYGYFPAGTGPQPGVKTGALPAIWEKNDEFKADAAKLVKAAAALHAAADSGNVDQVKAQFMAVGGACKECHQNFRAREE
jgi:cytochrome c556